MKNRRKRGRSSDRISSGNQSYSTDDLGSGVHTSENNITQDKEQCLSDRANFASRCSVRILYDVCSKFTETKKRLINEIGFSGLVHFPLLKQINRRFAIWIMSAVDENTSSIVINNEVRISFNKDDVRKIFGITCGGKTLLDSGVQCREAKFRVLEKFFGKQFKEQRSVKIVQEIVERNYTEPLSNEDQNIFKVAFVIFVCSCLLSPSSKHDYASIDYWGGIERPTEINTFDWSGYVVSRILEASKKVKHDISSTIKSPNITGCSLFLQVLYLDSLELGTMSMKHNSFPRIREFSDERYRGMIEADRNFSRYCNGSLPLGNVKLRKHAEVCYSWASTLGKRVEYTTEYTLKAIWETSVAMARLLNIPLEAAGPLFVACTEFHNMMDTGFQLGGVPVIKIMNVLVSIMMPYTRGFRYHFTSSMEKSMKGVDGTHEVLSTLTNGVRLLSVPVLKTNEREIVNKERMLAGVEVCENIAGVDIASNGDGNDGSQGSVGNRGKGKSNVDSRGELVEGNNITSGKDNGIEFKLDVNWMVTKAMARFYSVARDMSDLGGFDLNAPEFDESRTLDCGIDVRQCDECIIPSPWDLGFSWTAVGADVHSARKILKELENEERMVILHGGRKILRISGKSFSGQFCGKSELELDSFDALMCLFNQQDDALYGEFGGRKWRYYYESDVMGV